MDEPRAYIDSPWSGFEGTHRLFPYSILCDLTQELHPTFIFPRTPKLDPSWESQYSRNWDSWNFGGS
jgi:hypothetical protein